MAQRMGKEEVVAFLRDGGYEFKMVEHEAVFTMEGMEALNLPFGEEVVKNLFLRDDKKRNYYLVVMPEDKPANLKELRTKLEARPLRFASEDDLTQYLGLRGGAVSPFGVLNDEDAAVQVVFDEELRGYRGWECILTTIRQRCTLPWTTWFGSSRAMGIPCGSSSSQGPSLRNKIF